MKKLLIAACAAMLGIAVNAAQVTWSMTNVAASPDKAAAAGWAFYVLDSSKYSAFTALTGGAIATYLGTAGNTVAQGTTTSGRTGVGASVKGGSYSGGDTVNSFMVIFNNASPAAATYYAYTGVGDTTISAGGADDSISFGKFADATAATSGGSGGWKSVPEPTSGLLMLVGLGALALRRRRA